MLQLIKKMPTKLLPTVLLGDLSVTLASADAAPAGVTEVMNRPAGKPNLIAKCPPKATELKQRLAAIKTGTVG